MFTNLPSLADKAVYHFSHNDMDGYAPQVISRLSSVNTVEYNHCGYDSFEEELEGTIVFYENFEVLDGHAILITDIAPKSEGLVDRLNELFEKGLTVLLLDHHDTSKWIAEKYPKWAHIDSLYNGRKTCATELYHLYLKENGFLPDYLMTSLYFESFVEQVRSYDTWDWTKTGNVEAKELNSLLYIVGPRKFMDMQVDKLVGAFHNLGAVQYTFNDTEKILIDMENKREEKYIQSRSEKLLTHTWTVEGKDYSVGIAFGDQYHSTMGNQLHEKNPDLHFVAILDLNGGKASLRTIHDHTHVGEIAKAIAGGGGHQKAAGFQFDADSSLFKIENVMGVSKSEVATKSWKQKLLRSVK